jgi:2-oxoglutarate dehydrogenase E1 component
MEAVRQAMAKLGRDARPVQLRDYAKEHFGIVITADHASACKGKILRQGPAKAKPTTAKAATPAKPLAAPPVAVKTPPPAKPAIASPVAAKTPPAKPAPAKPAPAAARSKPAPVAKAPARVLSNGTVKTEAGISLKDILAVKELVGRVGASHLKTLIDAFSH